MYCHCTASTESVFTPLFFMRSERRKTKDGCWCSCFGLRCQLLSKIVCIDVQIHIFNNITLFICLRVMHSICTEHTRCNYWLSVASPVLKYSMARLNVCWNARAEGIHQKRPYIAVQRVLNENWPNIWLVALILSISLLIVGFGLGETALRSLPPPILTFPPNLICCVEILSILAGPQIPQHFGKLHSCDSRATKMLETCSQNGRKWEIIFSPCENMQVIIFINVKRDEWRKNTQRLNEKCSTKFVMAVQHRQSIRRRWFALLLSLTFSCFVRASVGFFSALFLCRCFSLFSRFRL